MYIFAKMYWRIRYDCLKQYVNTYKCWHNVNNNFQTKSYLKSKSTELNIAINFGRLFERLSWYFSMPSTNNQTCFYWYFNIDRFYLWMSCKTHSSLPSFKPVFIVDLYVEKGGCLEYSTLFISERRYFKRK